MKPNLFFLELGNRRSAETFRRPDVAPATDLGRHGQTPASCNPHRGIPFIWPSRQGRRGADEASNRATAS
jgi:hypothetical protein